MSIKIDGLSDERIRTERRLPSILFFLVTALSWLLLFYPDIIDTSFGPLKVAKIILHGCILFFILFYGYKSLPTVSFGKAGIVKDGSTNVYDKDTLLSIEYSKQTGFSVVTTDGREYHDKGAIFEQSVYLKLEQFFPEAMVSGHETERTSS